MQILILSLTSGRSYKALTSLLSFAIAHKRTEPFPAPDAARSLFLQTVMELTQEHADE